MAWRLDDSDDSSNDLEGGDEISFALPPLRLRLPAPTDMVVLHCPDEPLHIGVEDAVKMGLVHGLDTVEVMLVREGEVEPEMLVRVRLYTTDDAIEEWMGHLDDLQKNAFVEQTIPVFSLADIAEVRRNGGHAWADERPVTAFVSPGEWLLSEVAAEVAAERTEYWEEAREEDEQYDRTIALLLGEPVITTDVARQILREEVGRYLPELAGLPVVDEYVVPSGYREAQLEWIDADARTARAPSRNAYVKEAARSDRVWFERMAPLVAALDSSRLVDDDLEREMQSDLFGQDNDNILLHGAPIPSVVARRTAMQMSAPASPEELAIEEELRVPLPDPALFLDVLESGACHEEELPELMIQQTIQSLRRLISAGGAATGA